MARRFSLELMVVDAMGAMNDNDTPQSSIENRRSERVDLSGNVKIRFADDVIVGSGKNVSDQGVFFLAEGRVPVKVEIEGRDGEIEGELVRIENMGSGHLGIAVKFDDVNPI